MRNAKILLLLSTWLVLTMSCSESDKDTCVIKEAITSYKDDIYTKYVFFHDGTNYTEVRGYGYDKTQEIYSTQPGFIGTFKYTDGRISEALQIDPGSDYREKHEFTYVEAEITTYTDHYTRVFNGVVQEDRTYEGHFVENPTDGYYLVKNEINEEVLEYYENGNLVKLGFPDPTGTYQAYDTTWNFSWGYKYDSHPNALTEYATQFLIWTPNFGHCANNVSEEIGYIDTNSTFSKAQSFYFLTNNMLQKWVYEDTGRTITFTYDCK